MLADFLWFLGSVVVLIVASIATGDTRIVYRSPKVGERLPRGGTGTEKHH